MDEPVKLVIHITAASFRFEACYEMTPPCRKDFIQRGPRPRRIQLPLGCEKTHQAKLSLIDTTSA